MTRALGGRSTSLLKNMRVREGERERKSERKSACACEREMYTIYKYIYIFLIKIYSKVIYKKKGGTERVAK